MGKSSSPPPPDYQSLSRQDTQQAKDLSQYNANLNRIDQTTPFGSSTFTNAPSFDQAAYEKALQDWQAKNSQGTFVPASGAVPGVTQGASQDGSPQPYSPGYWTGATSSGTPMPTQKDFTTDNWSQNIQFSPSQQALFDSNNSIQTGLNRTAEDQLGRVSQGFQQGFDTSGLGSRVNSVNGGQGYEGTRDAVVNALLARQQPLFDQDRSRAENSLTNSGITKGTDAWNREMDRLGRQETDARNAAFLAGGQEQSRLAGLDLNAAQFQNQARGQGVTEQAFLRSLPLNELNALRSGSQVGLPQFPGYATTGTGAGGSALQGGLAAGNAANQAYATDTASQNATYAALATVLAAAMSDARLKTNIKTIGQHPVGVRRVSWDWKDGSGSSTGVIAQELLEVRPDAVERLPNGFYGVRYDLIGGR
jgi:hypothetical protein